MKRAKYAYLLEDSDVRRWYESTARSSGMSADVCLGGLGSFCELSEMTPHKFVCLRERELHNLLLNYVTSAEK